MTTRTPLNWSRKLLAPTLTIVLLCVAPRLHAQDCADDLAELETTLAEIEAIADDIAAQRDKCFEQSQRARTERDRCEGALAETSAVVDGLRVTVRDYERVIARHEARVRPWVWYAAGVATPIVATALGILVYLAAR